MEPVKDLIDIIPDGDTHHISPRGTEPLAVSTLVILGVAAIEQIDSDHLTPRLSEIVDPDALNAVFGSQDRSTIRVSFEAWDYHVTVLEANTVQISTRDVP